jgi:hypothetical protein
VTAIVTEVTVVVVVVIVVVALVVVIGVIVVIVVIVVVFRHLLGGFFPILIVICEHWRRPPGRVAVVATPAGAPTPPMPAFVTGASDG